MFDGYYFVSEVPYVLCYSVMPRVKRVESLFEMSVDFITENMDKFCKEMSTLGEMDAVSLERSPNVFNLLPSCFVEEIIKVLGEKGFLKKQFLESLITPRLHTLDFSTLCVRNEISDILHLAANRCRELKTLMLFHPTYFLDNEDYLNFIPKFTELQVLNISYSRAGDICLGILGSHCKNLRELYAEHSSVSDSGLQELFIFGQCKSIDTLDLDWTKVTLAGIQMALDNLPSLRVLHHQSTVQCLVRIHQALSHQKLDIIPKYKLSMLAIRSPFKSGSLRLAVSLCPLLTNVDIRMPKELTDVDLLSLLVLESLCVLKISGHRDGNITFTGGVRPLLKSVGNSLKSLELSVLRDVNIPVMTGFCPNLISLNLLNNLNYTNPWQDGQNFFKSDEILMNLEVLNLKGHIPSLHLFLLLFSPSLVCIRLNDCDTLTDEILMMISIIHEFHYLEHFEISNCNFVTEKGIDVLMQDSNALKKIGLKWCDKVTRKNICDWKKKADEKNWLLSISAQLSF